jgi:cytochrome c oxidase assembly factor CtaG
LAISLAALGVVFVAVCSPIDHYGRDILWVDFTGFLLLTMIAPPMLLLGAPLTLAFRASGKTGRKHLRRLYRCRFVAIVTFPVATWLLFAVATYLWQFTDLTDMAARHQSLRYLQQSSLLAVGLLFWNPAVAADPLRWRLPYPLRSLYVLVEMTHKGLFGGMFLSMTSVVHSDLAARAPAWAPAPLTDQRLAILILWIGGNLRREAEARAKRRAALDQVFQKPV